VDPQQLMMNAEFVVVMDIQIIAVHVMMMLQMIVKLIVLVILVVQR